MIKKKSCIQEIKQKRFWPTWPTGSSGSVPFEANQSSRFWPQCDDRYFLSTAPISWPFQTVHGCPQAQYPDRSWYFEEACHAKIPHINIAWLLMGSLKKNWPFYKREYRFSLQNQRRQIFEILGGHSLIGFYLQNQCNLDDLISACSRPCWDLMGCIPIRV